MKNLFMINKVLWKKDNDYILRCIFNKNHVIVKCHSVLNLNKGDEIDGDYTLKENKALGNYYEMKLAFISISFSQKKSIQFLSHQLSIKESISQKIYNRLGDNYIQYIFLYKDILDDIVDNEKEKERILNKLEELSFFYQYAFILDNVDINCLIKFYNDKKYDINDFNYYMLLEYDANVKDIDEFYHHENSSIRTKFLLKKYLEDMFIKNGDICVELNVDNILKQLNNYNPKIVISKNDLFNAINERDTYHFFTISHHSLYLTKNYYIEKDMTDNIKARMNREDDVEEIYIEKLSDEQNQALNHALRYNLSLIYGSAGTGKSYTIQYIADYLHSQHKTITLLSLTARVADKLRKQINCDVTCSTIHKSLNLNEFIKDNELSTLDTDYVIVDEASMININIFKYLFTHINIKTKIILCGDYNQLSPIGGGQVFRDLYDTKIHKTILTQIFRQSENNSIINNSYKIIEGQHVSEFEKDNHFFYINDTHHYFDYIDMFMKQGNIDINDVMIISASRFMTRQLNSLIQNKFNKKKSVHIFNRCFKLNDKVMHVKNNDELQIYNGNIGNIIDINNDEIYVQYDEKVVIYNEKNIDELGLAYAMTIHKSQGSEAKYVFVIVDDSQINMLNRNMLYTAITRAKEKVILIGNERMIDKAIDTHIYNKGYSQIHQILNA